MHRMLKTDEGTLGGFAQTLRGFVGTLRFVETLHCNVSTALLLLILCCFHAPAFAGLTDGLVAYWSFDDCTANDKSGKGNNGTKYGTQCVAGVKSKALSFNGSSDYVFAPHSDSLNITQQISYGAWVNLREITGQADNDIILNKEGIPYELAIHDNSGSGTCFPNSIPAYNFSFYVDVNHEDHQCGWADGGQKVQKNTWTFLFVTYDGSHVKTYFNGNLVKTYSGTGYIGTTSYPLLIAARTGNGTPTAFFNGSIDLFQR